MRGYIHSMPENIHIHRHGSEAVITIDTPLGSYSKKYDTLSLAAKDASRMGLISTTCEKYLYGQLLDGCDEQCEDIKVDFLEQEGFLRSDIIV
jgi:hypothetical protein